MLIEEYTYKNLIFNIEQPVILHLYYTKSETIAIKNRIW